MKILKQFSNITRLGKILPIGITVALILIAAIFLQVQNLQKQTQLKSQAASSQVLYPIDPDNYGGGCSESDALYCHNLGYGGNCRYINRQAIPACIYAESQGQCTQGDANFCGALPCKVINTTGNFTCLHQSGQGCNAAEIAHANKFGYGCQVRGDVLHVDGYLLASYQYPQGASVCRAYDLQGCKDTGFNGCSVDQTIHNAKCVDPARTPSCSDDDVAFCRAFGQSCSLDFYGQRWCSNGAPASTTPTSTPGTTTKPAAPQNLTVTANTCVNGKPSVSLSWSAVSNALGYNVYRKYSFQNDYSIIKANIPVGPGAPNFTDTPATGVIDGTALYRVLAGNSAGEGDYSQDVSVVTNCAGGGQKPGDINRDGKVDIFDYNQLVSDFGKTGTGLISDIDKSGTSLNKVDIFDYNLLVGNFGS